MSGKWFLLGLGLGLGLPPLLSYKKRLWTGPPTVTVLHLGGRRINFDSFCKKIETSFSPILHKNLKAVCLKINSPGGSPVQCEIIAKKIQSLSDSTGVPVYAFVEDVAVSGGYFIACGAQEIYASESSSVGGIGVVSQSFGLRDRYQRWHVDKHLVTAGDKAMGHPFTEWKGVAISHFISFVKTSRGDRLKGDESHLFSGEAWTGKEALELGLIDGVETDMNAFLRNKLGDQVEIVNPWALWWRSARSNWKKD